MHVDLLSGTNCPNGKSNAQATRKTEKTVLVPKQGTRSHNNVQTKSIFKFIKFPKLSGNLTLQESYFCQKNYSLGKFQRLLEHFILDLSKIHQRHKGRRLDKCCPAESHSISLYQLADIKWHIEINKKQQIYKMNLFLILEYKNVPS